MSDIFSPEGQELFRQGIWKDKKLRTIIEKLDEVSRQTGLSVRGSHFGSETHIDLGTEDGTFLRLIFDPITNRSTFTVFI